MLTVRWGSVGLCTYFVLLTFRWVGKNLKSETRKAGKEKHAKPHNSLLREKYHEKLRKYKKTCRSKRYFYLQDNLNEIEASLKDSKQFWEKWKRFEDNSQQSNIKISGEKLFGHFSTLHNETSIDELPEMPNQNGGTKNEIFRRSFSKK